MKNLMTKVDLFPAFEYILVCVNDVSKTQNKLWVKKSGKPTGHDTIITAK